MTQTLTARHELTDVVRTILLRDWDPIGIQALPENFRDAAQDEYDRYIEPLVAMVIEGADKSAFERYLMDISTQKMGGTARRVRAAAAADVLADLAATFPGQRVRN